jgi:hypothetical protein
MTTMNTIITMIITMQQCNSTIFISMIKIIHYNVIYNIHNIIYKVNNMHNKEDDINNDYNVQMDYNDNNINKRTMHTIMK